MKNSEYEKKLAQWEAEGYDVSELRRKWFPTKTAICARRIAKWAVAIVGLFIVASGVAVWQIAQRPAPTPAPAPVITLPDKNLEAAVREALGKPSGDITAADLIAITSLEAEKRGITSLTSIEYCTNLEVLNLRENQISDISALASLTNLAFLSLDRNQISDISALASLTNLFDLSLTNNQISDISALASLKYLASLSLDGNRVSDISALASLTNLFDLSFNDNQISDISALASLNHMLFDLSLTDNQISDISALAGLSNLRRVALGNNNISDISPLVANRWLGSKSEIWLENNDLNLSSVSEDMKNLIQLEGRGVVLHVIQ